MTGPGTLTRDAPGRRPVPSVPSRTTRPAIGRATMRMAAGGVEIAHRRCWAIRAVPAAYTTAAPAPGVNPYDPHGNGCMGTDERDIGDARRFQPAGQRLDGEQRIRLGRDDMAGHRLDIHGEERLVLPHDPTTAPRIQRRPQTAPFRAQRIVSVPLVAAATLLVSLTVRPIPIAVASSIDSLHALPASTYPVMARRFSALMVTRPPAPDAMPGIHPMRVPV